MLLARKPARQSARIGNRIARSVAASAPVGGWNTKQPLASMDPMSAVQLTNWFPQPGYIEVRKGYKRHAWDIGSGVLEVATPASDIDTSGDEITIAGHGLQDGDVVKVHATTTLPGGLPPTNSGVTSSGRYYVINATTDTFQLSVTEGGSAVDITSTGAGSVYVYKLDEPVIQTLAIWQGPTNSKMFAAAGGAFWNVTANQAGQLSRDGQHVSDVWQWCAHTTSGGSYLFMVNGSDAPVHYNGSSWVEPTITGITASDAVQVIVHKKRLWMVLANSTKAAYLGTEAISGAATTFEFGSLFTRGGYLQAVATWTRDGGSGSDDYLVAISSRGQVALYQGTDPASASTWALVGVFDVPAPIGRRCFHRYGADLLLVTLEGVFPLSNLLSVDQSQVSRVAITDSISPTFNGYARTYGNNRGWEVAVYPRGTRLIVNVPIVEDSVARQPVMNTITGAWCEYDNHNATTWAVFNDKPYFGSAGGAVYEADTGATDVDTPITAVGQSAYSAFGGAAVKRFSMIRSLVSATGNNRPSVGVSLDFVETTEMSAIPAAPSVGGAQWDVSLWDVASWSDVSVEASDWANVVGIGTFGSVKFQAQTGVSIGGGGQWGVGYWGAALWGSSGRADEAMRLQGFVLMYEPGGML